MSFQCVAVDGNWGAWGEWEECSVTCGVGAQYRWRECDDPPPGNGGEYCPGDNYQARECNRDPCESN